MGLPSRFVSWLAVAIPRLALRQFHTDQTNCANTFQRKIGTDAKDVNCLGRPGSSGEGPPGWIV